MVDKQKIQDVLDKFTISEKDLELVRAVGITLRTQIDKHVDEFYVWLENHEEFQLFFEDDDDKLKRTKKAQKKHWENFLDANIDEKWFKSREHLGHVHAHINLPNDIYFAGMTFMGKSWTDKVHQIKDKGIDKNQTSNAIMKLVFLDTYVVVNQIAELNKEKIKKNAEILMEISTPVTPIWDGILLLPLLGVVDSTRTQDIMNKSLNEIARTRAKVFVIDISGVASMDTAVANQLIKITKATQLMGCEAIISGVSPMIARTLVELGINIGEVKTQATLMDSFALALKVIGVKL